VFSLIIYVNLIDIVTNMAALEDLAENKSQGVKDNQMSTTRQKIAGILFDIPEPAAQTAALQLLRSKFVFDKSFMMCIGLVALAFLEELV
jgi:hypothetical protein